MSSRYISLIFIYFICSHSSICFSHTSQDAQDTWNAEQYTKHSQADQNFAQALISEIHLKGNEKILDLGSGDGRTTLELAKKVPKGQVIGLEPSQSMINEARKLKQSSNMKNVTFMHGSAETFTIDQKFDIIIAIHVMHWVKDQNKALQNIFNHLAPGGKVYFMMAPTKEDLPFERALKKTINNHSLDFTHFKNPLNLYDIETYRKLMVSSGFHIDNICYTYHQEDFANKQDFSNWLKQWLPQYKFLPFDKKEAFSNELIENFQLENITQQNSKIKWGEYIVILEATKPI